MTIRHRRNPARTPTLRQLSVTTVALLVAMIALLGSVALSVTRYQGSVFAGTMSEVRDGSGAMAELDRALIEAVGPMIVLLYRPDGGADVERGAALYADARDRIVASFDRAQEAIGDTDASAPLAAARLTWEEVDATVVASPEEWPIEKLYASFNERVDPWVKAVWEPLDAMNVQLADTRAALVGEMAQRSEEMSTLQQILGPTVLAAIVVAIALALLTVRRMSRRVLSPLAEVGHRAREIHDAQTFRPVHVPDAVEEVQDLAEIVNESASTLHDQHRVLRSQALTDSMTSLPNRNAFTEALHDLLAQPDGGQVAVLFIDLDDFKYVNDTLGHAAGDAVLRVVAMRLGSATRSCEMAARLGGDEFAVLLESSPTPGPALLVADRVHSALSEPVDLGDHRVEVACSIGIAFAETGSADDADGLLGCADFAMYMAKGQGKGRSEVYSAATHTEMSARVELRRELGEALENGQFEVFFQPLLTLPSQQLVGLEALLRWRHPGRGLLLPEAFLGLAEESGAIIEIGAWVLDVACATLSECRRDGQELFMSVNVSPRQLVDPMFAEQVLACIDRHGVHPSDLVLEITEAIAVTSTAKVAGVLSRLRDHGVKVALDDFGSGFSSLRYLDELPADVIKIDRSFISSDGGHREVTLEGIIALVRGLGLRVVAEGVETQEDLERLSAFTPLVGQGFLFAHPMAVQDILAYVRDAGAVTQP